MTTFKKQTKAIFVYNKIIICTTSLYLGKKYLFIRLIRRLNLTTTITIKKIVVSSYTLQKKNQSFICITKKENLR